MQIKAENLSQYINVIVAILEDSTYLVGTKQDQSEERPNAIDQKYV